MWLLNYVTKNSGATPQGEKGNIKSFAEGKVQINASSDFDQVPIVAPYGIAYVPPSECQTVVLPVYGGNMCLGVINDREITLEPGELMFYSAGGATLELKNDGYVYVNGVKLEV